MSVQKGLPRFGPGCPSGKRAPAFPPARRHPMHSRQSGPIQPNQTIFLWGIKVLKSQILRHTPPKSGQIKAHSGLIQPNKAIFYDSTNPKHPTAGSPTHFSHKRPNGPFTEQCRQSLSNLGENLTLCSRGCNQFIAIMLQFKNFDFLQNSVGIHYTSQPHQPYVRIRLDLRGENASDSIRIVYVLICSDKMNAKEMLAQSLL